MTPHSDECMGAAAIDRTDSGLDRMLLARTIDLAELGRPGARPNPVVGAVLATASGEIISTGHHVRHGAPHAERICLDDVVEPIPDDATLYVSLEPCSHHGRTPPCTDAIIERGVRRVVYASSDPNPDTSGRGPALLSRAGISVQRGPVDLERQALQQNAGFHSVHLRGRPYVTAKWAMTRTGRFSTGDPASPWISGDESRGFVHYLRAGSGAVACGVGTVQADDPQLTVRGPLADRTAVQPTRVVFDRRLSIDHGSKLVRSAREVPVLVCCASDAPPERELALRELGASVWRDGAIEEPGSPCMLAGALTLLAREGVNDVLLEAGPTLLDVFAAADLIDAAIMFVGPGDAPDGEPGMSIEHPLVARLLSEPSEASGGDARHHAVLHPAWMFPGATAG